MLDLLEEFRSVVGALGEAGVEYAVCGGLAVAIHVRPRATIDVDLLVPRTALEPAKQIVRGLGYRIEADPMHLRDGTVEVHRLSKPDPDTGDLLSVDFLLVTPALEPAWESRERVGWEHGEVTVVSRSGLVLMKRLRGSGQDQDDIRDLEAGNGEG
ncbi:MAG: hypothetical protein ABFS41_10045 [Myxococcota bacterium]